jgi:hypothetical protein
LGKLENHIEIAYVSDGGVPAIRPHLQAVLAVGVNTPKVFVEALCYFGVGGRNGVAIGDLQIGAELLKERCGQPVPLS